MAERYARIVDSAIAQIRRFDMPPDPDPVKGLDWLPYPDVPAPSYDASTHHAPVASDDIQAKVVVRTWSAPVAKTQPELDAEADATKERQLDGAAALKVVFRALLNHENRIRACCGSISSADLVQAVGRLARSRLSKGSLRMDGPRAHQGT